MPADRPPPPSARPDEEPVCEPVPAHETVLWDTGEGLLQPVTGVVVDEEGRPVSEATVRLLSRPFWGRDFAVLTDREGRFSCPLRIPSCSTRFFGLIAEKPGFLPTVGFTHRENWADRGPIPSGDRTGIVLRLRGVGTEDRLEGRVFDLVTGEPVAGAAVEILLGSGLVTETTSGPGGSFSLAYPANREADLRLRARAEGYFSVSESLSNAQGPARRPPCLYLAPRSPGERAPAAVLVAVRGPSESPVPGAAVGLTLIEYGVVPHLPPVPEGAIGSDETCEMRAREEALGGRRRDETTDSRGIAVFWPVLPDRVRIEAYEPGIGYASADVDLSRDAPGGRFALTLVPTAPLTIEFRGLPAGTEYVVEFGHRNLPQGRLAVPPNGRLEIRCAGPGTFRARILRAGDRTLVWEGSVGQVEDPQRPHTLVVEIGYASVRLSGTVTDAGGRPLAGALLFLLGERVRTDENGRFTFSDLAFTPRTLQVAPPGEDGRTIDWPLPRPRDGRIEVDIRLPD